MIVAKPVSLNVRPFQVSNLCFQVGGILGESFAELGTTVSAFDFARLYTSFRESSQLQDVPGRLEFDSNGIDAQTKTTPIVGARPFALGALRAEIAKAALNKAINQRENAFITKYGNVAGIVSFIRPGAPVKAARLARLSDNSQRQTDNLMVAYEGAGRGLTNVVTKTTSDVTLTLSPRGSTLTETRDPVDSQKPTSISTTTFIPVSANDQTSHTEQQTITNTGYEFRMPLIEELLRNDRAQIIIGDERDSHFLQNHYLDRIEEVYKNELASIDTDINQLQVAYLDSILLSPINGVVTGVYKNPGDSVSAGEPVFRVENNSEVLIIANVICRGPIAIGSMIQVKTPLFDSPGSRVTLEAAVVSARGQRDNDHWEVIAKCSNLDAYGKTIFPLGYNFDYDNTEVNIFGANEI